MGLFGFDPLKEAGGWESMVTDEEIADMEKQGYDMSSVRKKQADMTAQEAAGEEVFEEQRRATAVLTDLNKLVSYRSVPRIAEVRGQPKTARPPQRRRAVFLFG